ncbi:hypothetical protein [Stella sp.]|uniref:hypothetical protein n=1 Tax=Stella sp. TaxID=2912054 RepID=UPI0035AEAF77
MAESSGHGHPGEPPAPADGLAAKVAFLGDPRAYPEPVAAVEVVETHMSWVFLAGGRVYKLKKPVRFPYLDFSTLARRAAACRAEDRLNRRLAPEVYLGIVPLTAAASGLALGGEGEVVDWLVVMRRLDPAANLEPALRGGRLPPAEVERVAAVLRSFYRRARPVPTSAGRHRDHWRQATEANRRLLADPRFRLPAGLVGRIAMVQRRFLATRSAALAARVRAGRIVDAHGDLRPEHVWLTRPVAIIDCLEFDPRLRALDPLDELAFLSVECERLGAAWVGRHIHRRLAAALREPPASGLFLFYRTQRAMLRARLAIAHLLDAQPRTPAKWPLQARAYLRIAAGDARRLERLLRTRKGRRAAGPG